MTSESGTDHALHLQAKGLTTSETDRLLGEIANDFFDRLTKGEKPVIEDYVTRHPEIAALIRQTFAAVRVIEQSVSGHSGTVSGGLTSTHHAIGDFRIIREIGRGGMGVVYEAEQLSIGSRRVALKVLPFAAIADPRHLQRFQNEVRAAASLDHPNIVSVYSVGEDRGVHFYAMRLIRGQSMGQLIHELAELRQHEPLSAKSLQQALSSPSIPAAYAGSSDPTQTRDPQANDESVKPRAAGQRDTAAQPQALISTKANAKRSDYYEAIADLAIQAAEALDHAHQRGVIHRDIKPANLLIDAHSQLYLTDFGLAHIEECVGLTMTGDLIGTLRYMSPEQAMGKRFVVDYRTDIYSLGVSLYELLSTRPAFDGEDRAALLKQIAFEEPPRLNQVDSSIPKDLATIVHKAMAKHQEERYASAQELADDLRAFRACQAIKARPPTVIDRLRKFTRQNQKIVVTAMIFLMLTTIGLAISNSMVAKQRNSAEDARDAERVQRREADRRRRDAEENLELARETVDAYLMLNQLHGYQALKSYVSMLESVHLDRPLEEERNDDLLHALVLSCKHHVMAAWTLEASSGTPFGAAELANNALVILGRRKLLDTDPQPEVDRIRSHILGLRTTIMRCMDASLDDRRYEEMLQAQLALYRWLPEQRDLMRILELDVHLRLADLLEESDRHMESDAHFDSSRLILDSISEEPSDLLDFLNPYLQRHRGRSFFIKPDGSRRQRVFATLSASVETALRLARDRARTLGDHDSYANWARVAIVHYEPRDWQGAEQEVRLALQWSPDQPTNLVNLGTLLLLADKDDEYHELCTDLMERWQEWEGEDLGHSAALCTIDPVGPDDSGRLMRLAKRSVAVGPWWSEHGMGRALFRVGDCQAAVEQLQASVNYRKGSPFPLYDLSLAHHFAGNHEEATRVFNQAEVLAKAWQIPWPNIWLHSEAMRKEAREKIFRKSETSN